MFLFLLVIGLAGLAIMALPALGGHGHAPAAPSASHGMSGALVRGGPSASHGAAATFLQSTWLRFLPSPRLVLSLSALYGAFGNALEHAAHLRPSSAALAAVLPALLVERLAVTPLWNLAFRFRAQPSSPLAALLLDEARAVTPFRNGRGIVSVVRDGRVVQFSARLAESPEPASVRVGDRLVIEDVDADHERLTVSVPKVGGASQSG